MRMGTMRAAAISCVMVLLLATPAQAAISDELKNPINAVQNLLGQAVSQAKSAAQNA